MTDKGTHRYRCTLCGADVEGRAIHSSTPTGQKAHALCLTCAGYPIDSEAQYRTEHAKHLRGLMAEEAGGSYEDAVAEYEREQAEENEHRTCTCGHPDCGSC